MDFEFSPKWLAVLFIIAGVVVVFMLMGSSLTQLFSANAQESLLVQVREEDNCIAEASDVIPRTINNCPYQQGDM
jgi:hypothetical protein